MAKASSSHTATTYLVLDEELDTLNGGSGSLRDGGRDTTHCECTSARCSELEPTAAQSPSTVCAVESGRAAADEIRNSRTQEVDHKGLWEDELAPCPYR
jgi:hypothetical protein